MRSKGAIGLVVIALLIFFAGCAGCSSYNKLVGIDETVGKSWADVESQYQRRADLIPNLVNTVRGAAEFERSTLEAVTAARARATSIQVTVDDLEDAAKVKSFMDAQGELGQSLGRLIAVSEDYPELRATEAYRDLSNQIEGTENRIAVARRDYNRAVQGYNTAVRRFPMSIVAGISGFTSRTPFEAEEGAEEAVPLDLQ